MPTPTVIPTGLQNPAWPSSPTYANLLAGGNVYVPGRADVTYPGAGLASAETAYNNILSATDYAGLSSFMMQAAEIFDPMIEKDVMAHPDPWRDLIPRGPFSFFKGLHAERRIFRGGLPKFAGTSEWSPITDNPADGVCALDDYKTQPVAWERLEWYGFHRTWGSEPFCLDTLVYKPDAITQLTWILQAGADYGSSILSAYNRDSFVAKSVQYNRSYVMSSQYDGTSASPRYYYDPTLAPDDVTDTDTKASLTAGNPFIVLPANVEVEPINFSMLDYVHESLSQRCPNSAMGRASNGLPLFGLPCSHRDFSKQVQANPVSLENWRYARPEKLIEGYDLGVTNFNGWGISDDAGQLRFRIAKYVASYNSANYGNLGAALNGQPVFIAFYTPPMILNASRAIAGVEGQTGVPEDNPAWARAELAIIPVLLKDVLTNLMETAMPASLGSGTKFGPRPGLNGAYEWLNIISEANPKGAVGRFVGEFRLHPRPGNSVFHSVSFLYRRCTQTLRSMCPVDNVQLDPDTGTAKKVLVNGAPLVGTGVAADAAANAALAVAANANGLQAFVTLSGKLLGVAMGDTINFEVGGKALTGIVLQDAAAPKYKLFLEPANFSAPDLTTATNNLGKTGVCYCADAADTTNVGYLVSWTPTAETGVPVYTKLVVVPATDDAVKA